jgi:hypothetical protein
VVNRGIGKIVFTPGGQETVPTSNIIPKFPTMPILYDKYKNKKE